MAETATPTSPGPAGETPPQPSGPSQPPSPTPPAPDPGPTTPAKEPPAANQVAEAQRKQREAEREAQTAKARVTELEDKDRTELERAQRKQAEAEAKAAEAVAKAASLERNAWIRQAATAAGFHDPEDAVAHLSAKLDELDTDAKAKAAVDALAADESKSHLVGRRAEPTPMGSLPGDGTTTPGGEPANAPPADASDEEKAKYELGRGLLGHLTGRARRAGLDATTGKS